jgi:hypothetical protein
MVLEVVSASTNPIAFGGQMSMPVEPSAGSLTGRPIEGPPCIL